MENIFLTGDPGIGKSTIIRFIRALLPELVCGGFRTVSAESVTPGAMADVFIEKLCEKTPQDPAHLVGIRWKIGSFTAYPAIFDTAGVECLSAPPIGAALIIMDELGVMESDAMRFQQAVLSALDGHTPVLGILKPKRTPFLDAVRSHPRSEIIMVTASSRDALPALIAERLRPL